MKDVFSLQNNDLISFWEYSVQCEASKVTTWLQQILNIIINFLSGSRQTVYAPPNEKRLAASSDAFENVCLTPGCVKAGRHNFSAFLAFGLHGTDLETCHYLNL